ncbi:MAG TPA: calcium/sodium antiporter [Anaerohalosphaeraceae bacterium]|nr:calcium/sodium antiporter [Anaerohalosphaeraceae bacterium]
MTFLLIAAGLMLLYFGAEWLVKGAAAAAVRLGVTPLAIGLTVVAFGTSAPELTVSTHAALKGLGDIAVTNVVGSNIFNIAFILGLAAAIRPIRVTKQLIRWDVPVMIAVSVLCIVLLVNRHLSRPEGLLLVAGITAYTIWTFRQAKREPDLLGLAEVPKQGGASSGLWVPAGLAVLGLVLLVLGSKLLIAGALQLARSCGVSEAVIGLTIVSAGTSLPELATSVVAAVRKQADISIGNIVGSNIFNILGILGLSSLVRPYSSPELTGWDLAMMLGTALLLLPLLRSGFVLSRKEGLFFLVLYGAYLWHLWPR